MARAIVGGVENRLTLFRLETGRNKAPPQAVRGGKKKKKSHKKNCGEFQNWKRSQFVSGKISRDFISIRGLRYMGRNQAAVDGKKKGVI